MTTFRQLEIRRVYSASPGRAAGSLAVPARPMGVSKLGIATLIVASAWIYAAWFPTDRFMITALFMTQLNQPPEASGLDLSMLLKRPGPQDEGPAPPEGTEPVASVEDPRTSAGSIPASDPDLIAQAKRTTQYLVGDMFCWLAVMTVTGCYLAFCAGSSITLTPIVDAQRRRQLILVAAVALLLSILLARGLWHQDPFANIPKPIAEVFLVLLAGFVSWVLLVMVTPRTAQWLAIVAAGLLLVGGFRTWQIYGTGYPTAAPRIAAVVAMTIALLAGASATRRSSQLYGYAIWTVVAATVLTMFAIWYGDHLGGFQEKSPALQTYALIAMAQLSYALVLTVVQSVHSRKLAIA